MPEVGSSERRWDPWPWHALRLVDNKRPAAGEPGISEFEPVLGRAEARQLLVLLLAGCELVEIVDWPARCGEHRQCPAEGVRDRVVLTRHVPDVGGKLRDEIQVSDLPRRVAGCIVD